MAPLPLYQLDHCTGYTLQLFKEHAVFPRANTKCGMFSVSMQALHKMLDRYTQYQLG